MTRLTSRRKLLGLLAAAGGTVSLSGCNGTGGGGTTTSSPDRTATSTPGTDRPATPTPTVTPSLSTPTPDGAPTLEFDGGGAEAFAAVLDEARDQPGATIQLGSGPFRFDASAAPAYEYPRDDNRVHFDATGLDGVTIAGPGPDDPAEVVLEDPTRGFMLFRNAAGATVADRPTGPTVRDLEVRHDPTPFTQCRIESLSADRRQIEVAVAAGYPTFDDRAFTAGEPLIAASVFRPDGTRVRRVTEDARSNFKRFGAIEHLGDRRYRLRLADGIEPGGLEVGRQLAVAARHGNATTFFHADQTRPTYERVTLRTTANYAFEFNACDRPVLRDCVVAPPAEGEQLIATTADGVHCNNCPRGPLIEGCRFERTQDDAIVADNELMAVREIVGDRRVRVFAGFGTRVGAGDTLIAASPKLERLGPLPVVEAVDERGGGVTTDAVNPELIRFSEPIGDRLSVGDALTSARLQNRETAVRETTVRSTRARFVRFGGVAGGVIEDNEFVGTNSDGIEIAAVGDVDPGVSDLKGWSTDVRVRNNTITDVGLYGVPSGVPRAVFCGVDGDEGPPPAASVTGRPHRNVRIADNQIRRTAGHGVEIADVQGASLTNTTIELPGRIPVVAIGRFGLGIRNAADVSVEATAVVADDAVRGFGWRVGVDSLTTRSNEYDGDGSPRIAPLDGS